MKDTKERVLAALLDDQNQTLTAAASSAKVSRRTVYDCLNDEEFANAYRHQRELQAIQRADMLAEKRQEALWAIIGIMNDRSQPGAVRLKAASQILNEANMAQMAVDTISKSMTFKAEWF